MPDDAVQVIPRGIRFAPEPSPDLAVIRDQIFDAVGEGDSDGARSPDLWPGEIELEADGELVVLWPAVLRLVAPPAAADGEADERLAIAPAELGLPPVRSGLAPRLTRRGSVTDSTFAVDIEEWTDGARAVEIREVHKGTPWIALGDGTEYLLDANVWNLVRELNLMAKRPPEARSLDQNWQHMTRVRTAAIEASATLDDFLMKTQVLYPEHLHISAAPEGAPDDRSVVITPTFDGAPPDFINLFDRRPVVERRYSIPSGQEHYEIVLSDQVQLALAEIKRHPGRRLAGAAAQRFCANPSAELGPHVAAVVDQRELDALAAELQRTTCRFEIAYDTGEPARALVLVEPVVALDDRVTAVLEEISSPAMAVTFCARAEAAIAAGDEVFAWRGHELEIGGTTKHDVERLRAFAEHWGIPAPARPADVHGEDPAFPSPPVGSASQIDLSRYYERVEGIGVETPFAIARIPRPKELGGWLPDEIALSFTTPDDTAPPTELTLEQVADLDAAVEAAARSGDATVGLPDGTTMPTVEGEALIDAIPDELANAARALRGKEARPTSEPKLGLLIAPNIDSADFVESRGLAFAVPDDANPRIPASFNTRFELKHHQQRGVTWLQHLRALGQDACRGALLADDMGLGKTLQVLTVIVDELERSPECAPALIVAPVTLLENWSAELDRFFVNPPPIGLLYGDAIERLRAPAHVVDPDLAATGRKILRDDWLGDARIVLTTYETVRDLQFSVAAVDWSIVVCDEAQKIKNPNALWTRAVKKLKAEFRIAATGTPVENSIQDIWSIFDFIQPGLLDPLNVYSRKYRRPIESKTDEQRLRVEELRSILHPQILRRTKQEVATDLPRKIIDDTCLALEMTPHQAALYEAEVARLKNGAWGSTNEFAIEVLNALRYFRRICIDPRPKGEAATADTPLDDYRRRSPKFDWLITTLDAIKARDEKVIVFVEIRDVQRQLKQYLDARYGLRISMINGETSTRIGSAGSRQALIDQFQALPGFGIIILSPLAAGVGLNIQEANHVIHYARHWNPAREDQATDRAYRIGQTRDVTVYTPIVKGPGWESFDEKLAKLLQLKRDLAGDMLDGVDDVEQELVRDFSGDL